MSRLAREATFLEGKDLAPYKMGSVMRDACAGNDAVVSFCQQTAGWPPDRAVPKLRPSAAQLATAAAVIGGGAQQCDECGATCALQRCAKCKVAGYCGSECQKRAWPTHKPICKALVATCF